ncbi:MAG: GreA/GreB family elongation factor [Bacteroidales bacterium]|nr:GreA/GreB family elongation factor [Bacteroidales bacterium]
MSRGFIKEGDQEEIPMVPPRAYLPEGVPNFVTKEGLEALNEELRSLEEARVQAGEDYITVNYLDAKMKLLIGRINSAVETDLSKADKDTVGFGAWVRYNGRVVRIVGVDEANVAKGLVSFISPIAKALTGKKAGEVFELQGSGGPERIVVEEVSYEPLALTQIVHEKVVPTKQVVSRHIDPFPRASESEDCHVAPQSSGHLPLVGEPFRGSRNEQRENGVVASSTVEGPRQFEPEVNPMEFLPIVNERGNIAGRALYMELHKGNKILHPAVHLHVLNSLGATTRLYWWHVAFGEAPEKTLKRKMEETLGLSGMKPMLKRQYIREDKNEKELVYVFTVVSEKDLPSTPEGKDYTEVFTKD